MAGTEELEDSLFASLTPSKPKSGGKRRTDKPKDDQLKLFELPSDDDILDLLSDIDDRPKKTQTPLSSNKTSTLQPSSSTPPRPPSPPSPSPPPSPPLPSSSSATPMTTIPLLFTGTSPPTNTTTSSTFSPKSITTDTTLSSGPPPTHSTSTNIFSPKSITTNTTLSSSPRPLFTNTSTFNNPSPLSVSSPPTIPTITSSTTRSIITSTNPIITSPPTNNTTSVIESNSFLTNDTSSPPVIQFGSYVPSSTTSRRPRGPLELPSPKTKRSSLSSTTTNKPTAATKTVRFDTPLIDSQEPSLPYMESPQDVVRPNKEVTLGESPRETIELNHRQEGEQLMTLIKGLLKEEMTKRDEIIFLKFTQLESALMSEQKRLQDIMKSSINKVTDSVSALEGQMTQFKSLIEDTSKSIISTLSNELKQDNDTDRIDLSEVFRKYLDQLKEEQTTFWKNQERFLNEHISSVNQIDETNKQKLIDHQQNLEEERQKIDQLISKLEIQVCQKEKEIDKRQWSLAQSEAKVKAQVSAFEEQKQQSLQFLEEQKRLMEKSKEEFLKEQQDVLKRCYSNSLRVGGPHLVDTTVSPSKSQIELNAEREALTNAQLLLKKQQLKLEQDKQNLKLEQERLQYLESDLNTKASQVSEVAEIGRRMYQQGQKSLEEALELEQAAKKRFYMLKNYQLELQQKERQLVMEKVNTLRQQDWSNKSSVKETQETPPSPPPHNTTSTTTAMTTNDLYKMELSESLQQLLQRIEKDDDTLLREQDFLNVVKSPSQS